jgi:hypothetical protein
LSKPKDPPPYVRQIIFTIHTPVPPVAQAFDDFGHHAIGQFLYDSPTGGQILFDIPKTVTPGHQLHIEVGAPGYYAQGFPAIAPEDNARIELDAVTLVPVAAAPSLLPVHVDQLWFNTSDGQPWHQRGCSDFRLLQMFLAGEDIEPLLRERAAVGFNQLRVFLMCDLMFHLYPQEHPDYLPKLGQFLDRLGAHGLGSELTVLVDATRVMPGLADQLALWSQVGVVVRGRPQTMVELVNENDQAINTIAAIAFPRLDGVICSRGSNGADAPPVGCSWRLNGDGQIVGMNVDLPLWDYISQHPSRTTDWPRRVGHNTMDWTDVTHTPGTTNETCRPDQGRGPIPSDWFDAAANAALLCAGATMHSDAGKSSRLFNAQERACADAWIAGARAVPQAFRKGRYIAGHLGGFPIAWQAGDSSRAHGRQIENQACLSLPQMRDGYVPQPIDGWRIVSQQGSVLVCER